MVVQGRSSNLGTKSSVVLILGCELVTVKPVAFYSPHLTVQ